MILCFVLTFLFGFVFDILTNRDFISVLESFIYIFGGFSDILLDYDVELSLFCVAIDTAVDKSSVTADADKVAFLEPM